MNKKVILAVLSVAIIISALLISFFSREIKGEFEKNIDIYFLNKEGTTIECENRTICYDAEEELVELVIGEILKGPESGKLRAVSGKGTKLLNVVSYETNLTVNLSKEFLREDKSANMLSVYAIVKTLCQIDKVTNVMVMTEGNPVVAADGKPIGLIANSDINLENDTYTTDSKNIILYFATKDGKNLAREVRTIKITDTRPIESYIINELIKGPVNPELVSTVTADTELVSAETTNGTCHLTFKNFIEKNLTDPTNEKSRLAVYSVVNSLSELSTVSNVRFLFEGKTVEMLGNFNFAEVFSEDRSLEQ